MSRMRLQRPVGGLPEDHMQCARLAINTPGKAIADYYKNISEKQKLNV
ncbi:hypothetical protein SBDP1_850082 [Syntrophobacter sp. SbD1]|nr:hypothetical protein SBDP1_850082 [Syntrophobacter sp. SbD1]